MKAFVFAAMILGASVAWSHGEEKPGPNGGFIAMPGPFHTEVIPHKDGFHVYLLDIEFKNPTVKDSEVQAWVLNGKKKKTDLSCKVSDETSFHCAAKGKLPKAGQLVIKAKREQAQGNEAVYKLPLKHAQAMSPKGHEGHQNH